jgi:hypothetical protein
LSWRDTKAAIILVNRNKGFSQVLAKIKETMAAHPHRKRAPWQQDWIEALPI